MKIFSDLHIHSHYSRATSNQMNLEQIEKYGKIKGLNLIGTGDFTHPLWFEELKRNLREFENSNLFRYKDIFFMLTAEVSNIYQQDGKIRKIHNVILAPNFEVAEQITEWLKTKGRVDYDGRPIFGFPVPELIENLIQISKDIMIIPAHAWTPWFSIFGSKSGFDSVKECFQDQTKHIYALETGLSSDPAMNWRLSSLDKFALISNSDSHSPWPWRLGREANVFDTKMNYKEIINAIKQKDNKKFLFTIEVDPSYGKYHWDGHRNCNVFLEPKESLKYHDICPVCKRTLTIGVLHRVEELSDREENFVPKNAIPFKKLIPLSELIATVYNTGVYTKKVWEIYNKLIKEFGSELNILLETEKEKIKLIVGEKIAEIIIKNRKGKLKIQPGYDGIYGKLILNGKISRKLPQKRLSSFLSP
ncbi:MAG: endonuclease Q family protein [Candidatus Aenigmatarchaeota archaeon]